MTPRPDAALRPAAESSFATPTPPASPIFRRSSSGWSRRSTNCFGRPACTCSRPRPDGAMRAGRASRRPATTRSAVRFGDEVDIAVGVETLGRSSVTFGIPLRPRRHAVARGQGRGRAVPHASGPQARAGADSRRVATRLGRVSRRRVTRGGSTGTEASARGRRICETVSDAGGPAPRARRRLVCGSSRATGWR